MDSSYSSARSSVYHNSVSSNVVVESFVPSGTVLNAFTEEIVAYEKESNETHAVKKRQLIYMEQAFIVKAASVNIGATRAHHLLTEDNDAQMLIHKMENRKKHVFDFSFDYLVENAELTAIFWADEVSMYNYREFGDVVSLDATFKTNKYKMVFVPFTAIDNHRKCVTYSSHHQDGAMRNAIEVEFGGSKHRLCIWHITQKLHAKICAKIYDETDFKEKLNKIVWNMYIGHEEFETTSRSESENSFFSHFTNSGSTLMNFMNCFETTMEKQRHVQERMNHKTIDTVPELKTLLKIERHASNVYTRDGSVICSCQLFVRVGILCKHIFCVFKNANVEMIPQQYILRRWTKNLIPATLRNKRNRYGEKNVVVENYANEATSIVDHCVHLLSKDEPRLDAFVEKLKSLKKEGGNEKANEKTLKSWNLYLLCGGTDHNKRTCPRRFEGQDEVVFQKEVGQEEVLVKKEVCQEEIVQEKVDLAENKEELFEEDEDLIHE
nr:hypothetical protein [Tanacetum cinerariifolium]